jgi:hypothetical protein
MNAADYSKFFQWPMKSFVYKIITISTHFTITSAQHVYGFLTLVARTYGINNGNVFSFYSKKMHNKYVFFISTILIV